MYKNNIEKKIIEELSYIEYDMSLQGTQYLVEIIYLIFNDAKKEKAEIVNLQKEIYPKLAQKYNRNINTIRCSINYSTTVMCNRCDLKKTMNYFNFSQNIRPTVKQVIYTVLNKL